MFRDPGKDVVTSYPQSSSKSPGQAVSAHPSLHVHARYSAGLSSIQKGNCIGSCDRLLTVAVDADDVVTGFADGFGGVGQDGDGVVVTVTR
jgi:predicted metal-binding protein